MFKPLMIPAALLALAASSAGQPRYQVWNQPHRPSEKPDLQIVGGTHDVEGTGPCTHAGKQTQNTKSRFAYVGWGL